MLKGKIKTHSIEFSKTPKGQTGVTTVAIQGKKIELSWRKDKQGLWIELPYGTYGFDFRGIKNDQGEVEYQMSERNGHGFWEGLRFIREGEALASATGTDTQKRKTVKVKALMPGKIVRILTQVGELVEKDQPLLVMEAMKMENEIKAVQAGKITALKVTEGQAVESGAELILIGNA
jgi:biotin carboxyl carrier protein